MKKYIIYLITNKLDDRIYIGSHVTTDINDDYMGSGTNLRKVIKQIGKRHFHKDILYVFNNKEDMLAKELELVNAEFIKRTDTYNICLGGFYNSSGTVTVKDKDGNTFQVSVTDERYLSGELVGATKGNINVKNINGNIFNVSVNDSRYLSGELVTLSNGHTTVKDRDGNMFRVSVNDSRFLSGELVGIWKNKKHKEETKNLIGAKISVHQKGEGNSQYGTCWIYNQELKENKKIKREDLDTWLDLGWKKGRKLKKFAD